jgi:hypothetical protein
VAPRALELMLAVSASEDDDELTIMLKRVPQVGTGACPGDDVAVTPLGVT